MSAFGKIQVDSAAPHLPLLIDTPCAQEAYRLLSSTDLRMILPWLPYFIKRGRISLNSSVKFHNPFSKLYFYKVCMKMKKKKPSPLFKKNISRGCHPWSVLLLQKTNSSNKQTGFGVMSVIQPVLNVRTSNSWLMWSKTHFIKQIFNNLKAELTHVLLVIRGVALMMQLKCRNCFIHWLSLTVISWG